MKSHIKLIFAIGVAMTGLAGAQTTTDNTGRTAGQATRDSVNAVGAAASAAVTPGDQNMGRNPNNRSGGLMGNNRAGTDGTGNNRTGTDGMGNNRTGTDGMGNNRTGTDGTGNTDPATNRDRRAARADRG